MLMPDEEMPTMTAVSYIALDVNGAIWGSGDTATSAREVAIRAGAPSGGLGVARVVVEAGPYHLGIVASKFYERGVHVDIIDCDGLKCRFGPGHRAAPPAAAPAGQPGVTP